MKTLWFVLAISISMGVVSPLKAIEKVRIGTQGTILEQNYYGTFEALYRNKGYEIQWVQVPVERAGLEVLSGNLDASLFIDEYSAALQEDGFFVLPELFDMDLIVICSANADCKRNALHDESAIFIGPSIVERAKKQFGFAFRLVQVENVKDYLKMVSSGRYDYAIALGNEYVYLALVEQEVQYFKVEKIKMYHYISSNRNDILTALTSGD